MKKLILPSMLLVSSVSHSSGWQPSEVSQYWVFPNCGYGVTYQPGPIDQACLYPQFISVAQMFQIMGIDLDELALLIAERKANVSQ